LSTYDKEHLQLRPTDRPPRPVNKKMRLKESGGLAAGLMLTPAFFQAHLFIHRAGRTIRGPQLQMLLVVGAQQSALLSIQA